MLEHRTTRFLRLVHGLPLLATWLLGACATAGSTWMAEPLDDVEPSGNAMVEVPPQPSATPTRAASRTTRTLTTSQESTPASEANGPSESIKVNGQPQGRVLGIFRNTYYDFPNESDFTGENVALKNARCKTVKDVPRGFFEAVCVQGSGTLASGATVSFAKRDCECADECPRTSQRICFDELDPKQFPWGRGATGKAITPLLSVAVDSDVIPLGTALYIPEYDGAPRDADRKATHDGCFIAQDRGLRVKGKHVDVFTGHTSLTALWNAIIPSNKGVTVVLDSPRCTRANTD